MNFKTKLYRTLTGATVRKVVKQVESFCAENLPSVYKKIFLPTKSKAKSALLKYSIASKKKSAAKINFRNFAKSSAKKNFVSVIVPNYNHEKFLTERLESIYKQTYKNFEVILLDDCSTDNSRDILKNFYELHKSNTQIIFNEKNSGSVFNQWRNGIEAAKGNLIWIAESDDFCSENFLSELVGAFDDDSIQLAFCRSDFVQDGKKIFSTEQYLADLVNFDFTKNFSITAADLAENAFGIKNIIPNVSSAIFRKPSQLRAEILELWQDMKLCGDWLFYLEIIKGGSIYYTPNATNFYRIHKKSTSLKVQKEFRYYVEHEKIAEFVAENYKVSKSVHEEHFKQLEEHYFSYFGGKDISELKKHFDLEKILKVNRRKNILMCVFAMSIGGGETFPLILANELKREGFPVTVLNFQMSEDLLEVREKLLPDIPLLRLNDNNNLAEVAESFKIDILHTHHGAVDEATSYIAENLPSLKQVITLHGMYEATDEIYSYNLINRVCKTASAFVYIADKNLEPFKNLNHFDAKKFHKIGNGLEKFPVNPIPRSALNIPEKSFVCCEVSRAIPEKGWQAAIDAVTLANKKSSRRIDLILVGAGEMYDKLLGKVPDFVHLPGFKSNVRDYLATSDLGFLPSEFAGESFPLLIIDSLFSGKPVVCSNLGESAEMLKSNSGDFAGIVFDLVDEKVPVEKLSEILLTLANDEVEYKKICSQVSSAAEKFLIDKVAEKYIEVYNAV